MQQVSSAARSWRVSKSARSSAFYCAFEVAAGGVDVAASGFAEEDLDGGGAWSETN